MTAFLVILGIVLYFTIGIFAGAYVNVAKNNLEPETAKLVVFLWPLMMPIMGVAWLIPFLMRKVEDWIVKKLGER